MTNIQHQSRPSLLTSLDDANYMITARGEFREATLENFQKQNKDWSPFGVRDWRYYAISQMGYAFATIRHEILNVYIDIATSTRLQIDTIRTIITGLEGRRFGLFAHYHGWDWFRPQSRRDQLRLLEAFFSSRHIASYPGRNNIVVNIDTKEIDALNKIVDLHGCRFNKETWREISQFRPDTLSSIVDHNFCHIWSDRRIGLYLGNAWVDNARKNRPSLLTTQDKYSARQADPYIDALTHNHISRQSVTAHYPSFDTTSVRFHYDRLVVPMYTERGEKLAVGLFLPRDGTQLYIN